MKIYNCEVCGEVMPLNIKAYWNFKDKKSMHISCGEKEITVYRIEAIGLGSYYIDTTPPSIEDLMDGAEYGEGYKITKEKMKAIKYYSLPEFSGF